MSLGSILSSIGQGVASFAPTIATMLGGPMAGTAVTALEGALGLNTDPKADLTSRATSIANILQNAQLTPDQVAAIRLAEIKHADDVAKNNVDLAKINADHEAAGWNADVQDRASARSREVAVKDTTPSRLAYTIVGGFLAITLAQLVALIGWPDAVAKIPAAGWTLIGNISGYLAAEAKAATAYYFGSSSGSRDKDATIKAQADSAAS